MLGEGNGFWSGLIGSIVAATVTGFLILVAIGAVFGPNSDKPVVHPPEPVAEMVGGPR